MTPIPTLDYCLSSASNDAQTSQKTTPGKLRDYLVKHRSEIAIATTVALVAGTLLYLSLTPATISPPNYPPLTPTLKPATHTTTDQIPITVFSSFTTDNTQRLSLSEKVAAVHQEYCNKQGYEYLVFRENLARGTPQGDALPYWSKIGGMLRLLNDPNHSHQQWFAWVDDDMVITNSNVKLTDLIKKIPKAISVVVTEDAMSREIPSIPLNTGFILAKNDDNSRSLFKALWDMRFQLVPGHDYTYGNCSNQSCLHEQQALTDLIGKNVGLASIVQIISQRFLDGIGLNTFARTNHFDIARNLYLDYTADPPSSRWTIGDFMAQCTGLATNAIISGHNEPVNLREICIDELILNRS